MAPHIIAITMPKWGIEMTEGTITGWRFAEGQAVERGAEILDVETEKIVNTVEAPASGVLRRIVAQTGETHPVGVLIGVIADRGISDADIARFVESFVGATVSFDRDQDAPAAAAAVATAAPPAAPPVSASAPVSAAPPASTAPPSPAASPSEETRVSPIARRIAERLGVDVARVKGTGRNGRVSKEDVEAFAERAAADRTAPREGTADASAVRRVRMSARRGVIGRRLLESTQSIPHYRLSVDVDFGALLERRREHVQATSMPTTVNAWLLRAAGLALVQHPLVNAQLEGDEILQFPNADIAVAVATEAGLVTPILRSANLKPVGVIALECRELVQRARLGTLQREDITGGSFTISNLGMQGVDRFDAIINAPQVAILAVGSVAKRPVVRGNALGIADIGTLTLSADHRVIDGAVAASFMKTLVDLIERPQSLDTR